jgi:protein SCO1/2
VRYLCAAKENIVSQKALLALCIAIFLPLVSYFIVKGVSRDAIHMPQRYYPDEIVETVKNGKKVNDTIWHQVGNITLQNQLGETVSLHDLRGKIVVADYFFTHCPSICPFLTKNMKGLQDALKMKDVTKRIDTSFVHFVSFTVDPERDSVAAIKRYSDHFGVNSDVWWMLTGPKKTIYDFALNEVKLGLQDGEGVDSNFIHTQKFVVLDKKGVVRGYYDGLDTAALSRLAEDITLLMLEKDKNEASPVLTQLKGLWPVYIAVIVAVVLFVWITRKPAKEPKF